MLLAMSPVIENLIGVTHLQKFKLIVLISK
jgi:hypothetical protein